VVAVTALRTLRAAVAGHFSFVGVEVQHPERLCAAERVAEAAALTPVMAVSWSVRRRSAASWTSA
jgi:hypothetical protein